MSIESSTKVIIVGADKNTKNNNENKIEILDLDISLKILTIANIRRGKFFHVFLIKKPK